jgi:branched-chain amino acid transport system substrate-binding protein
MKKLLLATAATALVAGPALAQENIKLGIILGFTGPLESLTPDGAGCRDRDRRGQRNSGLLLGGSTVEAHPRRLHLHRRRRRDRGGRASDHLGRREGHRRRRLLGRHGRHARQRRGAERDRHDLAVGHLAGALDGRGQRPVLPHRAVGRAPGRRDGRGPAREGINEVAVTYTNNDYGKGLADAFQAAYEERGGTVTINAAHEDGKADYSAEVGALAAAGGQRLVVAGYVDQGGSGIVRAALDSGAFDTFHFPDGMISVRRCRTTSARTSTAPPASTPAPTAKARRALSRSSAMPSIATSPFSPEAYDAAALIMLAMQKAGSTDPNVYKDHVMDVANAPGEPILPGELAKALEILAGGGDVDYVGASAVELIGPGESAGNYRQIEVRTAYLDRPVPLSGTTGPREAARPRPGCFICIGGCAGSGA